MSGWEHFYFDLFRVKVGTFGHSHNQLFLGTRHIKQCNFSNDILGTALPFSNGRHVLPNMKIIFYQSFDFCVSHKIGGFRNSQSDVISVHAHIRGRQRFVQLYGICVKYGFIF